MRCCCEVTQSCPTLCDFMDCSPPGFSVHGILQETYWSGLPSPPPGDLPDPGIEPASLWSPALACRYFLYPQHQLGSPSQLYNLIFYKFTWQSYKNFLKLAYIDIHITHRYIYTDIFNCCSPFICENDLRQEMRQRQIQRNNENLDKGAREGQGEKLLIYFKVVIFISI